MKNKQTRTDKDDDLRRQAEERLKESGNPADAGNEVNSDALALVHELQVHQIELEMQNDELKRAKLETEDALTKYSDLYEFAPIGLFTIDTSSQIQEVNLTGATLLGVERNSLLNRRFEQFVEPKDRPVLADFLQKAFKTGVKQTCDLKFLKGGEPAVYVRIEGRATEDCLLNERRFRIAVIDITERMQAEEMLRESEEQLSALYASMVEGVALHKIVCDKAENPVDYIIEDVNPSYEKITGLTRDKAMGKRASAIYGTGEPPYLDVYARVAFSGKPESFETYFEPMKKQFSISVFSPNPGKFATVFSDITERKKTEAIIAHLASFPELNPSPVVEVDLKGQVLYANPSAQRLFPDLQERGLSHQWLSEFDLLRRSFESGQTRYYVRDVMVGERFYQQNAYYVEENRSVRIYGIDVTERKRAEEDLKDSERLYRAIGESNDYGVWVCAPDGRNIYASESFLKLVGLTQEQCSNFGWGNVLHPIDAERTIEAWKECVRTGGAWDMEHRYRGVDGEWHDILARGVPVRNERGEIIFWAGINLDISSLKHAEDELKKARDELELKVKERTADLQNAKEELECINEELGVQIEKHERTEKELVKARNAAEESARAKASFLANMSHELRTPMNAVIGFSSLLLDDNLTKDQREYIEGIRNGGEALLAIISEILEFSKADKEKVVLEHQPFSLKHLIDESLDLVAIQAAGKGLNLSQTINYGTPDTFIGDHGRLRQILVNLLSNAVKFTDKGDVSVSVSSKAVEGDRHQIFFEVNDTGIGIPQDKMNELFEPFTQVERILSLKRDGVGLGLSITKQLVELMGGKIWVKSIPGQNTTFSFMIPTETIPGKQLNFGKIDRGVTYESFLGLKPMRILVAEDNPSNQRVLVEMLRRLGYRADAVADGREVIQALERQDYDLVLMDVKMQEMDGITATQVIRKLRPENRPKIIAITAFALEGDREKCFEAGMDDYIAKPVQIGELAEVLKKYQPSRVIS